MEVSSTVSHLMGHGELFSSTLGIIPLPVKEDA